MAKAKARTRIVGWCSVCDAPAVSRDGKPALLFHAPGCSELPDSQTHHRCQNPDCWAVLDAVRVRRWGAKTCDAACRAAAFRARHGIVPVGGRAEAQTPVRTARRGRYKPPGPQLSYHKAVEALARMLVERWDDPTPGDWRVARWKAAHTLRPVLPAAQRARLEAREK